jgi:hypothetical protein
MASRILSVWVTWSSGEEAAAEVSDADALQDAGERR